MKPAIQTIKVLGSSIHLADLAVTTAVMEHWITGYSSHKKCRQLVVTGFHGIWEAHKHPDFKAMLNSADLWVPDGIAPVWVARLKGLKNAQRTPGAEIMLSFFELADEKGYSSFFYGDRMRRCPHLREILKEISRA
jgi:N-acetylglucosaminyldiphosphoundecaprenol N-acetyl-beta-D-mannosaminyltransferase